MASAFVPRPAFPSLANLPRSYFLGHHRAGLTKMKTMLSSIELVIECRDYRVPLTSRNPLFEESLAGRERLIVYTKQDLGSQGRPLDRRVSLVSVGIQDCRAFADVVVERGHHPLMVRAEYAYSLLRAQTRSVHPADPRLCSDALGNSRPLPHGVTYACSRHAQRRQILPSQRPTPCRGPQRQSRQHWCAARSDA